MTLLMEYSANQKHDLNFLYEVRSQNLSFLEQYMSDCLLWLLTESDMPEFCAKKKNV